ncbi:MAG: glycine cleavage system protein H [Planctomycetota bacterium]|nr:glycine cleavage system protein H [Planctomycetota bacterium]
MAALLAILMFALFITLDWALSRRRERREAEAAQTLPATPVADPALEAEPELEPVFVAGYEMPERLHYHRGHTWVRLTGPDTAVVGVDDFGRRLLGTAHAIELPEEGDYVFQGGQGARIQTTGRAADLVAPIAGEVVARNEELEDEPELVTKDPYRRGWLYRLRSPHLAMHVRNLLSGSLARRWMEDARERLDHNLMAMSGSVLADGGEPAQDFGDHVEFEDWKGLVEGFLLTQGYERAAS